MNENIKSDLFCEGIVALPASWNVTNPFLDNFIVKPEIVDFDTIYQTSNDDAQEHVVSIMKFADGTETKCILDISDGTGNEPDEYTAFLTCYCKKILGDDFHKTWKYWTEKRPEQRWKKMMKEVTESVNAEKAAKVKQERRERKKFRRMVKQKEFELRAEIEARKNIEGEQS
jgi:hypothetical protein